VLCKSAAIFGRNLGDKFFFLPSLVIIIIILDYRAIVFDINSDIFHIRIISKRVDVYPLASINNFNINKLTTYKIHHPKTDTGRLCVERKERRRVLLQIEAICKAEVINIAEYLKTKYKQELLLNIVNKNIQPNRNSTNEKPAKVTEDNGSLLTFMGPCKVVYFYSNTN
jgi:hypothetical protein